MAKTKTKEVVEENIVVEKAAELKVAASSSPKSVAGAVAGAVRENQDVTLKAIGAGAVNQALKGLIIANGYLAPNGIRLATIPGFGDVEVDGESRTMIKLELRKI